MKDKVKVSDRVSALGVEVSTLLDQVLESIPGEQDARGLVVLYLARRAGQGAHGARLLLGQGLEQEAALLVRSALEAEICLRALANDQAFLQEFILSGDKEKRKLANALANSGDPDFRQLGKDVLAEGVGLEGKPLKIEQIAHMTGVHEVHYTACYRELSTLSHVTALSLERFLAVDPSGQVKLRTPTESVGNKAFETSLFQSEIVALEMLSMEFGIAESDRVAGLSLEIQKLNREAGLAKGLEDKATE